MARVAGLGVTVIVATGPAVTITVADPDLPPLVAVTALVNVPVVLPAVKTPVLELMRPGGLVTVRLA